MANYIPKNADRFSLLSELPNSQYGIQMAPSQGQSQGQQSEPWIKPETAQAAYSGMQSGGLSGALMGGGTQAMLGAESMGAAMAGGGPWAIAGGLLLSELEAAQKAKAQREAEEIANEKNKRTNMTNLLQNNSKTKFSV